MTPTTFESSIGFALSWRHSLYLIFVAMLIAAISGPASALDLVIDGEPAAVIVVPDEPLEVETYAAEELRHHLRKASGAELEIIGESEPAGDGLGHVYIGRTRATLAAGIDSETLPDNGHVARLVNDDLFFVGDDASGDQVYPKIPTERLGTLRAVYEFLDDHLGVRWVWPGELGEVVPERSTIRVEEWDRSGSPRLASSAWFNSAHFDLWPDRDTGIAHFRDVTRWERRLGFTTTHAIRPSHNFYQYWERFGESNPEFFNLLPNGKRVPLAGDPEGRYITMCVSNPAFHEQIIQDWEDADRPAVITIGENDTPGMCTCEACRAWDAPDWRFYTSAYWAGSEVPTRYTRFVAESGIAGDSAAWGGVFRPNNAPSLSDRYARFVKSVYERASALDPEVRVSSYAYANYWRKPKTDIQLPEGVILSYVPPLWYPYTQRMSDEMREHWDGWRATGATMMFRPNLTYAGHAFPIYFAEPLVADIQYLIETGSVGMEFDTLVGSWAVQGPSMYALARATHRPEMSVEEILDEYYDAFGPASEAVEHYFNHWRDMSNRLDEEQINLFYYEEGGAGSFRNWALIADRIFTPEIMAEGRHRLDAAVAAAEGDELAAARVAFLDQGLTHAQLILDTVQAHKADPADEAALAEAVNRLYDYRREIQDNGTAEMGNLIFREPQTWRQIAAGEPAVEDNTPVDSN